MPVAWGRTQRGVRARVNTWILLCWGVIPPWMEEGGSLPPAGGLCAEGGTRCVGATPLGVLHCVWESQGLGAHTVRWGSHGVVGIHTL